MTNENTNMIQEHILKGLKSDDSNVVIDTITELRESGNVACMPLLLDLLSTTPDQEIKKSISGLFANLKDTHAIPFLISAIRNPKYAAEIQRLVSGCWENGLDYSNYLSVFVDLLLQDDFSVAFEAYTVIVNTENKIDQDKINLEIERLEKVLASSSQEKRSLILDVIDFLPSIGI